MQSVRATGLESCGEPRADLVGILEDHIPIYRWKFEWADLQQMSEIAAQSLDQFLLGRMRTQTQISQSVDRFKSGPIRNQEVVGLMLGEPKAGLAVEHVGRVQPGNQKRGIRVNGHRRRSRRAA